MKPLHYMSVSELRQQFDNSKEELQRLSDRILRGEREQLACFRRIVQLETGIKEGYIVKIDDVTVKVRSVDPWFFKGSDPSTRNFCLMVSQKKKNGEFSVRKGIMFFNRRTVKIEIVSENES